MESVFVMSHVSPGCSRSKRKPEWIEQYTDRFYQIVSQVAILLLNSFFSVFELIHFSNFLLVFGRY